MSMSSGRFTSLTRYGAAWLVGALALVLIAGATRVKAQALEQPGPKQPSEPPTAKTHPNDPMIWNTDAMIEDAVQQIARRYNLNQAQEQYTRLLMTQKVKAFLKLHEDDLRTLLKEMIDFRNGLKPASAEAIMDWAARALPVLDAAKEAIFDGNKEWGQILTDEQKKTHQMDLDQMTDQFTNMSKMIGEAKEGKGPLPAMFAAAQATGAQGKTAGMVTTNPAVAVPRLPEDNWMQYVEQFVSVYKLDEKQQNSAKSGIYKDQFDKARKYRDSRKGQFEKLGVDLAAARREQKDPKAVELRDTLQAQLTELEEPIRNMFVDLDRHLKELPTTEQRAAADPAGLKMLEARFDDLSGKSLAKAAAMRAAQRSTTQSTSRPATTQAGVIKLNADAPKPAATTQPAGKPATTSPPPTPKPAEPGEGASPKAAPAGKPGDKPKIPDEKPKIPDPPKQDKP